MERMRRAARLGSAFGLLLLGCDDASSARSADGGTEASTPIVDTAQALCYRDDGSTLSCPSAGSPFHGQDAQHLGHAPSYVDAGDGTVLDSVTGLVWQKSPDLDGDGTIDASDKRTYDAALPYCEGLVLGGHSDWRLPTIGQLYSLMDFRGTDPSGFTGTDTSTLVPFVDTRYFDFGYGDTAAGERVIDAQYASRTLYVAHTANDGGRTLFGVNFADGRIKGYGLVLFGQPKTFYVRCVRGNTSYGTHAFTDGGDGTIADSATGLVWAKSDSGTAMRWADALAWVDAQNAAGLHGRSDWRLPDAKELQSLVDYTRSPDTTGSAAIDPIFEVSSRTNEAGQPDFPFYWTSTTHASFAPMPGAAGPGAYAVYVSFGRAMGYMNGGWVDVHGAGAQRSDPKTGNPADYPTGHGPQGDAIRILHHVRLVRDATP